MRFSSGRTRSRSQPGISCSVSSTTVTLTPSAAYTRGHFEADDAAADDEQALRQVELERAGRVDDARIVRQPGQPQRFGPRGDDAVRERHAARGPVVLGHVRAAWSLVERRDAAQHGHLALLRERRQSAGEPRDDFVLPVPQLAPRRSAAVRTRRRAPPSPALRRSPWPRAAAPSTECSRRSGRRRRASASVRPARR